MNVLFVLWKGIQFILFECVLDFFFFFKNVAGMYTRAEVF